MTIQVEKTADILEDGEFVQEFKVGSRTISIISFKNEEKNVRLYRYDNLDWENETFRPVIDYSAQGNVKFEIRTVAMRSFSVSNAEKIAIELEQVKTLIQEVQTYLDAHGITKLAV